MKSSRVVLLALAVVLCALAVSPFVPKLVSAQTAIITPTYSNCGYISNGNCTPGVLQVYLVSNSEGEYGMPQLEPSNFTVTVQAQNSAPVSFPGSQSGTNLSVLGQYTVTAAPENGYTPTYSTGCSGLVVNGQNASCTITESAGSLYTQSPVPYPYPYTTPTLGCAPSYQVIGLGQSVTFSAVGGMAGPFNWSTPERSYQAISSLFTTSFDTTGTQVVTVSGGSQIAQCTVDVVPVAIGPTSSALPPVSYVTPATPPPTLTAYPTPSLPDTGYGPLSNTQLALITASLVALCAFLFPYVRNVLAVIG